MKTIISNSTEQTEAAGRTVAEELDDDVSFIALYGEMGAGKTAFVRGFVSILSPGSRVKSPTYTIVNEYTKGQRPVYHFDFYRLNSPYEIYEIGFDGYLQRGVCISEWSERLEDDLPDGTLIVKIGKTDTCSRLIRIFRMGEKSTDESTGN